MDRLMKNRLAAAGALVCLVVATVVGAYALVGGKPEPTGFFIERGTRPASQAGLDTEPKSSMGWSEFGRHIKDKPKD
jgi:hypothetical protein